MSKKPQSKLYDALFAELEKEFEGRPADFQRYKDYCFAYEELKTLFPDAEIYQDDPRKSLDFHIINVSTEDYLTLETSMDVRDFADVCSKFEHVEISSDKSELITMQFGMQIYSEK